MRFLFGSAPADYVVIPGTGNAAILAASATLTAWSAETGGVQYTDLAVDAAGTSPVSTWATDSTGRPAGIYGPDEIQEMWVSANDGTRVLMTASDAVSTIASRVAGVINAAGQPSGYATLDGTGRVPATQLPGSLGGAIDLGDLADVSAPATPTDGSVPAWSAADGVYAVGSVLEASTKSDPLVVPVLTEPMWKITQDHVPDASEPNTIEFWSTYSGTPKLVGWINERGLPRGEQIPGGTGWENPFKAIVNVAGTGAAYAIDRRNADNSRTAIGGLDVNGRLITSLQDWTAITAYDPGSTGKYVAQTSDYQGQAFDPLAVRYIADDRIEIRGLLGLSNGATPSGQDVLFTLPTGFAPAVARAFCVGTSYGKAVPIKVLPNGNVINVGGQAQSGAIGTYYMDGQTYRL